MGSRSIDGPLAPDHLRIAVSHPSRDIAVITPDGEIDMATAPLLVERVTPELYRRAHVVIDLTGVAFLASRGVQAIVDLRNAAAEHGTELHLVGRLQPIVARILSIAGLSCVDHQAEDVVARLTDDGGRHT